MKDIFFTFSKWNVALGLVVVFAAFYLWGIPKTAVNVADSDDLSLAAYTQSLAHPPGYNLQTSLASMGRLFPSIHFAPFSHALNAIIQSLAVGMFFVVSLRLLETLNLKRTPSIAVAIAGSVWWGLNRLTYQNAVIFEVFSLASLVLLVFIYAWLLPKTNPVKLGLLSALALFAHQLTLAVTVFAMIARGINMQKRTRAAQLAFAFCIGCVLLLSTYWFYFGKSSPFGWHIEPYLFGVIQFVTRATLQGGSAIETYASTFDVGHSLASLVRLVELISKQSTILVLPLAFVGWWKLQAKHVHKSLVLGIPTLIYVLIFVFYLKFPTPELSLSDTQYFWGTHLTERMMFGLSLMLHLLATLGLAKMYAFLLRYVAPRTLNVILLLVALLASGFSLHSNHAYQQFSISDFSAHYSQHLLSVLPEHAVVIVDTDIVFGLLYAQIVEGVRPDVAIVPQVMGMRGAWFYAQAGKLYEFGASDNETQAALVVHHALNENKPVFIYHPSSALLSDIQAMSEPVHFTPVDFWLKVEKNKSQGMLPPDAFAQELMTNQSNSLWLNGWRGHLATLYAMHAYFSGTSSESEMALEAAAWGERMAILPQTKAAVEASLREGFIK
jgi:hypothetical protein